MSVLNDSYDEFVRTHPKTDNEEYPTREDYVEAIKCTDFIENYVNGLIADEFRAKIAFSLAKWRVKY